MTRVRPAARVAAVRPHTTVGAATPAPLLAALLAALGRPSWWLLGLAGFLVRGGILVFLVAIVDVPSPLALSNVLAPIVQPIYLGTVGIGTAIVLGSAVAIVLAWIVVGGWFAAATEIALVREARDTAREEGLPMGGDRPDGRRLTARATVAHFVAHLPTAVVLLVGSIEILRVAYDELTTPSDVGPIVIRVLLGALGPVVAILAVWVLGEIVGGAAVRRIVLGGEGLLGACARAAADIVRRPVGSLVSPIVTIVVLVVDLAAVLATVMVVWTDVRERLVAPLADPLATALTVASFGAAWCLALVVTGLIEAWRSATMTFEAGRRAATDTRFGDGGPGPLLPRDADAMDAVDGTYGASTHRRPGDWSTDDPGGSL